MLSVCVLPVGDVLTAALSSCCSVDCVVEATGIIGDGAEGVHVHYTHVSQSLTCRTVREQLQNNSKQLDEHTAKCLSCQTVSGRV